MRASKQRLTLLKKHFDEIIPEEDNVFGYPGISKRMILAVIDDSYSILSLLDDYENHFEVILLERNTADHYERISNLLRDRLDVRNDNFNKLLNLLAKLHYRIKETFISVAKEPIRTEYQIKSSKETLNELQGTLTEILPIYEEIKKIKTNCDTLHNGLANIQTKTIENGETINTYLEEIESLRSEASTSAQQIPTWEQSIQTIKEDIGIKTVEYAELKKKVDILKEDSEKIYASNKQQENVFANQLKQNEIFSEQIQKTIEDSNRHGMAGSFKKRKDELKNSLLIWGVATVLSIIVLISVSYNVLLVIKKDDLELGKILARLPIFASCVWLGWFCSKQFGFTSRIMEDYSYKYAVSMAFEGYKNATKDIDQDLQMKLLELTIYNISQNPLSIYETKNNHGTPIHELMEQFPKGVSFKKKAGEMEAEAKIGE
jgi:uncharacterized coiled-coil DUF342 family protein